jgi:putative heme iron utilization protein
MKSLSVNAHIQNLSSIICIYGSLLPYMHASIYAHIRNPNSINSHLRKHAYTKVTLIQCAFMEVGFRKCTFMEVRFHISTLP